MASCTNPYLQARGLFFAGPSSLSIQVVMLFVPVCVIFRVRAIISTTDGDGARLRNRGIEASLRFSKLYHALGCR